MKFLTLSFIIGWASISTLKAEDTLSATLKKRCDSAMLVAQSTPGGTNWTQEIHRAEELYFYGSRCVSSSEDKKTFHLQGLKAAQRGIISLTGGNPASDTPKDPNHKTELARAHYYAAVNLSRWGQAKGLLTALNRWDEVKDHLNAVVKNDAGVYEYGAARTFGRAYMKLPFFKGGSDKKSHKYLTEAYTKTLHKKFGTSTNVLTTLFYLDILAERNKDDEFCEVYSGLETILSFDENKAMELNADRVLENLLDIQNFNNASEDWIEDIKDKVDIDC